MKTIIQQISRNLAAKANLEYEANTFAELYQLLNDVTPVLKFNDDFIEDGTYPSLKEMINGYFSSCYTPDLRVVASNEVVTKLMNAVNLDGYYYFSDAQFDELYESIEDMPEDIDACLVVTQYNKLSALFEQIRQFSARENCELKVIIANIYPDRDTIDDNINYSINCGTVTGGGEIELLEENSTWYLMRVYWLCYAFANMSMEEVASMNIEIVTTKAENEGDCILFDCGALVGLNYKYGKTPNVFDTEAQAIELVRQYPVLINYIPEKWQQSKDVILSFIESNDKIVGAYYSAIDESSSGNCFVSTSCIRLQHSDLFRNGFPVDIPVGVLAPFYKDEEVLTALAQSYMWSDIWFSGDTYDEQVVTKVICNAPALSIPLYEFWKDEIADHRKIADHVKCKYELRDKVSLEAVAMYKCLEVIDSAKGDTREAKARLFANANYVYNSELVEERKQDIAKVYRTLDLELQNYLADEYYPLLAYMRADDVNPKLAETVAQVCPIAATLLPDEYILKYKLEETDEQPDDVCASCKKCHMGNIRIV